MDKKLKSIALGVFMAVTAVPASAAVFTDYRVSDDFVLDGSTSIEKFSWTGALDGGAFNYSNLPKTIDLSVEIFDASLTTLVYSKTFVLGEYELTEIPRPAELTYPYAQYAPTIGLYSVSISGLTLNGGSYWVSYGGVGVGSVMYVGQHSDPGGSFLQHSNYTGDFEVRANSALSFLIEGDGKEVGSLRTERASSCSPCVNQGIIEPLPGVPLPASMFLLLAGLGGLFLKKMPRISRRPRAVLPVAATF